MANFAEQNEWVDALANSDPEVVAAQVVTLVDAACEAEIVVLLVLEDVEECVEAVVMVAALYFGVVSVLSLAPDYAAPHAPVIVAVVVVESALYLFGPAAWVEHVPVGQSASLVEVE